MIRPTNGRIVLFTPAVSFAGGMNSIVQHDKDQKLAAMVCHVFGPSMVNLLVTDSNGIQHAMTSVTLLQDDDPVPANGRYCEWMEFQKGQAAKTDAAEALRGQG